MRRVFVVLGVVAVSSACTNTAPTSKIAEPCLINSDCAAGLACVFRVCHQSCRVDGDCDPSSRCIAATDPAKTLICVLPSDTPDAGCRYDSQCPSSLVCGKDLVCRNQCLTSIDCVPDQLCVSGTCAKRSELIADGGLPVAPTAPEVQRCSFSVECPGTLVCRQGVCLKECLDDRDCTVSGYVCDPTSSRCVRPPSGDGGMGAQCRIPSDCSDPLICANGTCGFECRLDRDCNATLPVCCRNRCASALYCSLPLDGGSGRPDGGGVDGGPACVNDSQCDDNDWCNGPETCNRGVCQRAPRGPCDDSNPCTVDTCINSPRTCSNVSTGPVDVDHDGYYDARCGLGADDCDDTRADVHPGAIEKCDWVDNNCNGSVDENAWVASGVPAAVASTPYYPLVGGPQAVALDGEVKVVVPGWGTTGSVDAYRLDLRDLTLGQGPTPLIRSQTQWVQCGGIVGQVVFAPRVFAGPNSLLTTGFVASAPGVGCCPSANGAWSGSTTLARTQLDFSGLISSDLYSWVESTVGNQTCSTTQESNDAAGDVIAVWVSARSHWRLFFSDRRDQQDRTVAKTIFTAILSPTTGMIDGLRPLFQVTNWTSENATSANVLAFAHEVPGGVFVAWNQRPANGYSMDHVRWALFDADLNAPAYQPVGFTWTGATTDTATVTGAAWNGDNAQLHIVSGNQKELEIVVSMSSGALVARATENFRSSGSGRASSTWSAEQSALAGSGAGFFLASKKASAIKPTLLLTWGRQDFDGGFFSVEAPIGLGEPSPYQVIPISPTKVGVLWVSGLPDGGPGVLTRQLFQCTAP